MTTGWDDLEICIPREFMNLQVFRIHEFLLGERKGEADLFTLSHSLFYSYFLSHLREFNYSFLAFFLILMYLLEK